MASERVDATACALLARPRRALTLPRSYSFFAAAEGAVLEEELGGDPGEEEALARALAHPNPR